MARRGNNEGSIYKRKDGRWAAALTTDAGKRRHFYAKTRAEVAQKLRSAQDAQQHGLPLDAARTTVAAFLDSWLRTSAARKVRPRTLNGYEQIIRLCLAPSLGRVRLARLTPHDVERMMNEGIANGRSARSVAHDRAVLRTALNVAMRQGVVGRNVAMLADAPRVPEREFRALTPSDARRILAAVDGHRHRALFTVALAVGLRQSEALGLQWDDVDLDRRTLVVRRVLQRYDGAFHLDEPKTPHSKRTVEMPEPVCASLREHRARQLADRLRAGAAWNGDEWGGLVFCDERGQPLHGTTVAKQFQALVGQAGLRKMRYHDLRHGAASLMAAQGVPPRIAMEVLGHAQISTTMNVYSHVAPESRGVAAKAVEEAIWGT